MNMNEITNSLNSKSGVDTHNLYLTDGSDDFKMPMRELKDYVLGADTTLILDKTDMISTIAVNGSTQKVSLKTFDEVLNGSADFQELTSTIKVRCLNEDDTLRGYTSLGSISTFIGEGVDEDSVVADKLKFQVFVDGAKSKVTYSVIEALIFGTTTTRTVADADKLYAKLADGSKVNMTFGDLKTTILPATILELTDETLIQARNSGSFGTFKMSSITAKVVEDLSLPTYVTTDTVTSAVKFNYLDINATTSKPIYGYMSATGLKKVILNDTVTEELTGASVLRLVDGVINYSFVRSDILETVANIYGVDPDNKEDDIEDGDGLMYVSNGDEVGEIVYRNLSYVSLRDKILGKGQALTVEYATITDDTTVTINDSQRMTIGMLKTYLGV